MRIRVLACQQSLSEPVSPRSLSEIRKSKPEFVCLPEHYPLNKEIKNLDQAAAFYDERKSYLADLSRELQVALIGGTLTEKTTDGYYNTCYVFQNGKEVGFYRKVYPTQREQEAGVLRGNEFKIFDVCGLRVGVLICADVLNVRSFEELTMLGCQITFIPTASPLRAGESLEEKYERDKSIFLEGARKMGCPIIKTCGVGIAFGHPLQGRSLITTPEKIVARAEANQEQENVLLLAELTL